MLYMQGECTLPRRSILRTPDDTNSRYIELKSVNLGLKNHKKTLDVTNSRYDELFTVPLKVRIIESLLCMEKSRSLSHSSEARTCGLKQVKIV